MANPTQAPPPLATSPRALEQIRLNALLAADTASSSDDDELVRPNAHHDLADENEEDDTARNAIGVSIGRAQTRLTSPKTPAVEKQAAIERAGGFFPLEETTKRIDDDELDEEQDGDENVDDSAAIHGNGGLRDKPERTTAQSTTLPIPQRAPRRTDVRLPSPEYKTEASGPDKDGRRKSGLLAGLERRRASTVSGLESMLDGWHRALLSNLPLIRKNSSGSLSESRENVEGSNGSRSLASARPDQHGRQRSADAATQLHRNPSSGESEQAEASIGDLAQMPYIQRIRSRPGMLRRSTSDGSLVTTRTLSRVSSLGDDSRFEDVREMVNSRMKAIKDTWQDSSLRMTSMPRSFSVANFTPDFLREYSASLSSRRQSTRDDSMSSWSSNFGKNRLLNGTGSANHPGKVEDPMTRRPYAHFRDIARDAGAGKHSSHPHFHRALERLEGDIVILGGYRGSILRSAEPPHRQLWVPVKVGLNLRKVNLEVGIEEGGDERADETVIPGGMLTHIGPVDISRRLLKRLRGCENARNGLLRVHEYGYDWRLDPNFLSKQLQTFLRSLPSNQPGAPIERRGASVIAHSLGGLITRHAVNQQPELFRGVVYAGVPKTCVNILGPLRNGDEVLLSSRVLTAQVNFSIRTSFALLPLDGRCFIDKDTKEEYRVDFFDPQTWVDYRLSPCVARPLPPLNPPEKSPGLISSVANALPNLPSLPIPGRRTTDKPRSKIPSTTTDQEKAITAGGTAEPDTNGILQASSGSVLASNNVDHESNSDDSTNATSIRTAVTIPREAAIAYLTRTLASVKSFKQALAFNPTHAAANIYPPVAVIYGKSTPTVYGARVAGREGIAHTDAYDDLAFASGDGVVLARAAMVPEGYRAVRGGVVSSERGHVTLLGDLEAVGRCLNAVVGARGTGVGIGKGI